MGLNVLVVDDSLTVRAVITKTLQLTGLPIANVYEASDGREALGVLEREWIDLVFADLHMPRMTGIELVEHMAGEELLRNIPVVIVSSEGSSERIARLREQGIRAYIRKPFTPEQMREVVQEVVGVTE
jgi:two-component system chemotaxis response regulator CheY